MNVVIGLGLFLLGGFIGVAVMCLVQVGRSDSKEKRELRE
ncbi:DUF3789 domain-containing protein [Enterococcus sp. AZ196]